MGVLLMGKKTKGTSDELPAELAGLDGMTQMDMADQRAIRLHENAQLKPVGSVVAFLEQLELSQYADTFEENDISQSELCHLTDEHLREMEVNSIGHRIRIIQAMGKVKVTKQIEEGNRVIWEGEDLV